MQYRMMAGKIHRATVTEANLNYIGSITIDRAILDASGLLSGEMVQITNLANGEFWQTYIIPGPTGRGDICLNGPPARKFHPGDLVIIIGFRLLTEAELAQHRPAVVFVDEKNRVTEVKYEEPPFVVR